MDKIEVERKIAEAANYLREGNAERAELWMTRLLAEDVDLSGAERAYLRGQATELMARAQFAMKHYEEAMGTFVSAAQEIQNWLTSQQFESEDSGKQKNGEMLAGILQNLCFAYLEKKRMAEAENTGLEAIAVARQYASPDSLILARTLFGVSIVWYRKGDYAYAQKMLEEALKIFRKQDEMKMAAFCLNNLGRISEELGDKEQGVSLHRQAVALRRQLPDKLDLAFSLGNLGVALANMENWQEAEDSLAEAISIYKKEGKESMPEYAGFLKNLEICHNFLQGKK